MCVCTYVCLCTFCVCTVEHSYNKPEIPGQSVCYKQEFVISGQFPMRYCSTWLRLLLCYIKKFVIEEFVIRVVSCLGVLQQIKCCSTPRQDTTITTPLYIGMYVICYIRISAPFLHTCTYVCLLSVSPRKK